MAETKRIQDRIVEELKLNPIEEEVVVLYKGESKEESPEFWKVSIFIYSSFQLCLFKRRRIFSLNIFEDVLVGTFMALILFFIRNFD